MTTTTMLFDVTLLLFLLAASLISIKSKIRYMRAAQMINVRGSTRMAFRFLVCLILLAFCAVNVSSVAFVIPVLSAVIGVVFLFETVSDKAYRTLREYRKTILVLYLAIFLLMTVSQGEAVCLLLMTCLLENAAQYYLDWDTYNNRFNH